MREDEKYALALEPWPHSDSATNVSSAVTSLTCIDLDINLMSNKYCQCCCICGVHIPLDSMTGPETGCSLLEALPWRPTLEADHSSHKKHHRDYSPGGTMAKSRTWSQSSFLAMAYMA